jgi:hypothetical protein
MLESWHNLVDLYEAWSKSDEAEAEKCRAKLTQKEASEE